MDEERPSRRRDAQVNRESLLEAALRTLLDAPDAGLDAVAATAGLSRRTVYGHFPSREALVAALADRAGEHLAEVVRRVRHEAPPAEPPLTTLARLEIALWRAVERYRLLGSLATRPEHRARVSRHTGDLHAYRIDLLTAARADGDLAGAVPVTVVARLMQSVPLAVFDAVLEGALEPDAAARVNAMTALAVSGASPDVAEHHVDMALTSALAPRDPS